QARHPAASGRRPLTLPEALFILAPVIRFPCLALLSLLLSAPAGAESRNSMERKEAPPSPPAPAVEADSLFRRALFDVARNTVDSRRAAMLRLERATALAPER